MDATERYTARQPDLVWTLHDLGLLDEETAERNDNRWHYEWGHLEQLWDDAERAWKQLSWWRRIRIGVFPGKTDWKIEWRREHDPWREGDTDGTH